MEIRQADKSNINDVVALAHELWNESDETKLINSLNQSLSSNREAVFIAVDNDRIIAFANITLRTDYVEGTSSNPVAYLEGIYVLPEYRCHGIAKKLIYHSEKWALKMNCTEFASDCELSNQDSYKFHLNTGFIEANRIICFTKKIGDKL